MDYSTLGLLLLVLTLLALATLAAYILRKQAEPGMDAMMLEKFYSRLRGWWLLFTLVGAAAVLPWFWPIIILFGAMSFWAMREFITLTPTRPADHRTLSLVFFICIPMQYLFVLLHWQLGYSIFIPVYVFLAIPILIAASGDTKRFLERIAKISFGLLICVYCLSYAPALMTLEDHTKPVETETRRVQENAVGGETAKDTKDTKKVIAVSGAGLLCFLLLMTQLTEIFQYASLHFWPEQHSIAPAINTSKTWEGLIISSLGVMFVGVLLSWATPFWFWEAGLASAVIAVMSFGGSLTLSAVKRDRGVDDYGTLVEGHGGILDRIDTLCFAAPIFFHLTMLYVR